MARDEEWPACIDEEWPAVTECIVRMRYSGVDLWASRTKLTVLAIRCIVKAAWVF